MNWFANKSPDPLLANSNQEQFVDLVSPEAELHDPTPDLLAMFQVYDFQFFDGKLSRCTVEWSKRLKSCAGVCQYRPITGLCTIRMSEPLLKLRPRRDFVETLLHEMIHAYLFVTERNTDRGGHGENFQAHMHRINRLAGTNITIYHSFHAEVNVYKRHVWKCNGICQSESPFYGYVKRTMNRAPSKSDLWFADHQATCGGTFQKIKEPEDFKSKTALKNAPKLKSVASSSNKENEDVPSTSSKKATNQVPSTSLSPEIKPVSNFFVPCPSCKLCITISQINAHLDTCLK
ncbi:SprT-like domain-containing protein [Aphelenchoides bicaudatus]|nr:SprT-like domain-containing protein [Aphelenchoides bicaudatus]